MVGQISGHGLSRAVLRSAACRSPYEIDCVKQTRASTFPAITILTRHSRRTSASSRANHLRWRLSLQVGLPTLCQVKAKKFSHRALSKQSPTDSAESHTPASLHLLPNVIEIYWQPLIPHFSGHLSIFSSSNSMYGTGRFLEMRPGQYQATDRVSLERFYPPIIHRKPHPAARGINSLCRSLTSAFV